MTTVPTMITPLDFRPFPWMRFALQEVGVSETRSHTTSNPRILVYQYEVKNKADEDAAWCSAFANWCMTHGGQPGTGLPNARSWLNWGQPVALSSPTYGCVAVFSRPPKAWLGHVGFYVGSQPGSILVLGGNQSSPSAPSGSVCVKAYSQARLLGYRWPSAFPRGSVSP
jgi:uncharacterized protein (TIGR02594 family)